MLTFKPLIINDVDVWKSLLTSVLTFKPLAINDVALVDLYTSIYAYSVCCSSRAIEKPHRGLSIQTRVAQLPWVSSQEKQQL
jgi:hypothetical protein